MKSWRWLFVVFTLVSISCGLPSAFNEKLPDPANDKLDVNKEVSATPAPAGLSGSDGAFSAAVTSPITVELAWEGLSADAYRLEISVLGSDFTPYRELAGDIHAYEDFPVLPDTHLAYRLIPVTGGKDGSPLEVAVQTPPQVPDPLKVNVVNDIIVPDPTKLDFSELDLENMDPDNFDPSSLGLDPVIVGTSAEIGAEGGEMHVTGSSGAEYTYTVPAGALDANMQLNLMVIADLEGAPLSGGLLGAVLVNPPGLDLNVPALLTIVPPPDNAVTEDETVATFNLNPDGSEFYFTAVYDGAELSAGLPAGLKLAAPAAPKKAAKVKIITIPQRRTGAAGAGKTTRSQVKQTAVEHPPSSKRAQVEQNEASETIEIIPLPSPKYIEFSQRSKTLNSWDDIVSLMDDMDYEFLWTGTKEEKEALELMKPAIQNLIAQMNKEFKKNLEDCVRKDDFSAYLAAKNIAEPKSEFAKIIAEQYKQAYGLDLVNKVLEKTKNCWLRLDISSTVEVKGGGGYTQFHGVTINVPLEIRIVDGQLSYTGDSFVFYAFNDIKAEKCKIDINLKTRTDFYVQDLRPRFDPATGKLVSFDLLKYTTSGNMDKKFINCPDYRGLRNLAGKGKGDPWISFFTLAHKGKMEILDFNVYSPPNGGVLADKQTKYSGPLQDVDGRISRDGTIEEHTKFEIKISKLE